MEVALELAALLVPGRDDARSRRLELLLLALSVCDLADDHQELILAARREARFVVARLAGDLELVLDHLRRAAVDRGLPGLEHAFGQLCGQAVLGAPPHPHPPHGVPPGPRRVPPVPAGAP